MIQRLYIDNFKCLTNFEIKPSQISCLVGPNGGGKSAVFAALQGIQGFLGTGVAVGDAFQPLSRTRWDKRLSQRIELDVRGHDDTSFHYELLIQHDSDGRNTTVERETLSVEQQLLYEHKNREIYLYGDIPSVIPTTRFPFDPRRSFLPLLEPRSDNKLLHSFKQWINGMWLFSLRPSEIEGNSSSEAIFLDPFGKNFPSWFRSLMQEMPGVAEAVVSSLTPVIPGLKTIKLSKISIDARIMLIDCELSGQPFSLSVQELSDGQRSLLILYTILHAIADRTSLLVFDEPDNFVAEAEIQPWLSQIREAVFYGKRGSLMVLSHHPTVIDYLAADQALLLWRAEAGPTRLRDILVNRESGITASEWLRLQGTDAE